MIKILILADDITGALDTGVKFAINGALTKVATDRTYDFSKEFSEEDILVINTETRHLSYQEAYKIVFDIVKKAIIARIPHIYKKTDSALRGNIGSELTALLEASNEKVLPFLPAYPLMNRLTINGIHYIDGVPVHLSEFGKDPFEPVTSSYIPEIIHQQLNMNDSNIEIIPSEDGKSFTANEELNKGIYIFDTENEEDLVCIAQNLMQQTGLRIMAGCAGFASTLPEILRIQGKNIKTPELKKKFLVVCGSVNQITRTQLDYAEKSGLCRKHLTIKQEIDKNYFESESGRNDLEKLIEIYQRNTAILIDTSDSNETEDTINYANQYNLSIDDIRIRITENLGYLTKKLLESDSNVTLMLTGGDTLMGFLNRINCNEVTPICEMQPGTVLAKFRLEEKEYFVISKSGGFGQKELIVNLASMILKE